MSDEQKQPLPKIRIVFRDNLALLQHACDETLIALWDKVQRVRVHTIKKLMIHAWDSNSITLVEALCRAKAHSSHFIFFDTNKEPDWFAIRHDLVYFIEFVF
ncbi:hypothetical protein KJ885_04475 [Patescibacteria group bacterium]|nr:hypothetical protein [Patescibacteria group bacterium]